MHVLRRSFCKSWWNDRWRDLTAAYLTMLDVEGIGFFSMPQDEKNAVLVCSSMMKLISPISIAALEDSAPDEEPLLDFDDIEELEEDLLSLGEDNPDNE